MEPQQEVNARDYRDSIDTLVSCMELISMEFLQAAWDGGANYDFCRKHGEAWNQLRRAIRYLNHEYGHVVVSGPGFVGGFKDAPDAQESR